MKRDLTKAQEFFKVDVQLLSNNVMDHFETYSKVPVQSIANKKYASRLTRQKASPVGQE